MQQSKDIYKTTSPISEEMRKRILILILFFTDCILTYGQQNYSKSNYQLIDSLKRIYFRECTKYEPSYKIKSRILRRDKKIIQKLNTIYDLQLSNNFDEILKNHGFTETAPEIKIDYKGRTISKYFIQNKGNIRAFVQIAIKNDSIIYQRILIATNTKFYCSLPNSSFNIFYVDFMYLKELIDAFKFPLSVALSNTELQTERFFNMDIFLKSSIMK